MWIIGEFASSVHDSGCTVQNIVQYFEVNGISPVKIKEQFCCFSLDYGALLNGTYARYFKKRTLKKSMLYMSSSSFAGLRRDSSVNISPLAVIFTEFGPRSHDPPIPNPLVTLMAKFCFVFRGILVLKLTDYAMKTLLNCLTEERPFL